MELLSREEREIESMVAQIEQKQKRLNELEGLMSGLYEKQQMLLNAPDDYTTPPMSTTNATIDSESSTANDRIERIERLLIHGMFDLSIFRFLRQSGQTGRYFRFYEFLSDNTVILPFKRRAYFHFSAKCLLIRVVFLRINKDHFQRFRNMSLN